MPKERLTIAGFQGLFDNPDPTDVGHGATDRAENLDVSPQGLGRWRGLPANEEEGTVSLSNTELTRFESFSDADTVIASTDAGVLYELDAAFNASVIASGNAPCSSLISVDRTIRSAHTTVENPIWLGFLDHAPFDDVPPNEYRAEPAELEPADGRVFAKNINPGTGTPAEFKADHTYFIGCSVLYDGFQEGPLEEVASIFIDPATNPDGADVLQFQLEIEDTNRLPNRATAVNLYIAEGVGNVAEPDSPWRFSQQYALDDPSWFLQADGFWDFNGNVVLESVHDLGGADYEQRTGIPPTLEHMNLWYDKQVQAGAYHFVGNVNINNEETNETMIVRSKAYRPDQYDWSTDVLFLEQRTRAMAYFAERVFVFGETDTYVIEPRSLTIEDVWPGYTVFSNKAFATSPSMLFMAGPMGLVKWDGLNLETISSVVDSRWEAADPAFPRVLLYDPRRHAVLYYHKEVGQLDTLPRALIYQVDTQRWTRLEATPPSDQNEEVYAVDGYVPNDGGLRVSFYSEAQSIITMRIITSMTGAPLSWSFATSEIRGRGDEQIWYHAEVTSPGDPTHLFFTVDVEEDGVEHAGILEEQDGRTSRWEINSHASATTPWVRHRVARLLLNTPGDDIDEVTIIKRDTGPR